MIMDAILTLPSSIYRWLQLLISYLVTIQLFSYCY